MITNSDLVDVGRKRTWFRARLGSIAALFLAVAAVIVISGCSVAK